MTLVGAVAVPPNSDTVSDGDIEILELDPDVVELLTEVDAILSAALAAVCRPPKPLAIGCAVVKTRRLIGRELRWCALRRGPVRPVRAAQRSPPAPPLRDDDHHDATKGR
jgi:hypothetical protein